MKALVMLSRKSDIVCFQELELSKNHLWPHLYLYSSQDTIIPSHHVLEMVQGRKLAGVSLVKTYDFRTTDHVGHLNDYKVKNFGYRL